MKKRGFVGVIILMGMLMIGSVNALAEEEQPAIEPREECTSWVFVVQNRTCVYPQCGPGAILKTPYESGYRYRYCNSSGRVEQPWTVRPYGCC